MPYSTTIHHDNSPAPSLSISQIVVGERHRRDLGDIAALAKSIAEVGLLQPIAVTFDGHLVAGERRLRAVEMLGWKTIPYTPIPINLDQIVRGEFAENTCRKDFTLSEAVAIKRALEPMERAAAKERMIAGRPVENSSGGRALDKVAAVVGKHRTTIARAEAVVDAAEAEPERFGKLLADMDRTGKVDGAHRKLLEMRGEKPAQPTRKHITKKEEEERMKRHAAETRAQMAEGQAAHEMGKVEQLQTRVEELTNKNSALTAKLAKAEAELTHVKAELAKAKAELDEIIAAQVDDDALPLPAAGEPPAHPLDIPPFLRRASS